MPDALAGFDIQCNEAGAEQVVDGSKSSIEVERRAVRWHIYDAAFLIR